MSDVNDDLSASTQRFKAFAESQDQDPRPWEMRASGAKIWILVATVIVVAIVVAVVAKVIAG